MSVASDRWDVAGTGSMVVDRIARVARLAGVEQKVVLDATTGAPVRPLVGGVTLNHLGWAAVLGLRTAIFGKQGDDADGRLLRAGMARLGIEPRLDLSGGHSSFAHVYVDPRGERGIYMARGATAELTPDEIDRVHADVIARAEIVTSEVSQVPLATVLRVLERAHDAGARTVVDLDVPLDDAVPLLGSEAELQAVLEQADVIKPSAAALRALLPGPDPRERPEDAARALLERYGATLIALTLGAEGALLLERGSKPARVPAARVRVVDTTGAGDAFLGGVLFGLRRGLALDDLARLASACGAVCCEQMGAFPDDPMRCRERVLALYAELGGTPLDLAAREDVAASAEPDPLGRFLETALRELERAVRAADRAQIRAAGDLVLAAESRGGRVHVTGVGKPEHVAHYAASLLASTGTPAMFLHATEATHGSIGQLVRDDVVLAISNSGTTPELLATVEAARAVGARIVAVTRDVDSPLARAADVTLAARVEHEGGPLDLAPRASVLAEVLMLGALSVELQARKGLTPDAYALRHPAGALGRKARR